MNGRPGNGRLPVGPLVATIGAVLLIVSLFLDWYEGDLEGFTVFEFLDLLLVLMALLTIASLAGGLGLVRTAPSPVLSLAVALFTIYVVVSQLLNDPPAVANGDAGKEIGIWLALGGATLMGAGALLAFARISLTFERRVHSVSDTGEAETIDDDVRGAGAEDATRPLDNSGGAAPGSDPERPRR